MRHTGYLLSMIGLQKNFIRLPFHGLTLLAGLGLHSATASALEWSDLPIPPAARAGETTHRLPLHVYLLGSQTPSQVVTEINATNQYFAKCGIAIDLQSIKTPKAASPSVSVDWLRDWETFWFNDGKLTRWEKEFFGSPLPKGVPGLIFVESLNWTTDGQGTWAAAYAPYLENEEDSPEETREFLGSSMEGYAVIGRYRAPWTTAHELAHSILNLKHSDDPFNVMHTGHSFEPPQFGKDGLLLTDDQKEFTPDQCNAGFKGARFLKPVETDPSLEKFNAEIGWGTLATGFSNSSGTPEKKTKRSEESCAIRFGYDDDGKARLELDYLGFAEALPDSFEFCDQNRAPLPNPGIAKGCNPPSEKTTSQFVCKTGEPVRNPTVELHRRAHDTLAIRWSATCGEGQRYYELSCDLQKKEP